MTIPAVILAVDVLSPPCQVGGLPLLVRHLKELHKLGVRECYILGMAETRYDLPDPGVPQDVTIYHMVHTPEQLPQQLQTLLGAAGDFLLIRGEWLIDPRLLAALLLAPQPQWLQAPHATPHTLPVAARLSPALLHGWATAGLASWLQASPPLPPETLDTYLPSHRGHKPFYLQAVTVPVEAVAATQTLIAASQKQALDLPALLLHPMFENRLVFGLCQTPITPNHVTLFNAFLGAVIAGLFLNGWLRLGILLAHVVAIFDGVDGKLARTTLRTSRLGEIEHIIDFFVEQAWYLTLTAFLATSTSSPSVWWIGGGLMAADLLDKLLYMLGHILLGKQLDELGCFDRRFRLLGGRRNVYLWILLLGFWAGFPPQALIVSCGWALCTLTVHSMRFVYHLRRQHLVTA